jgi:hypothetical protein
MQQTKVGAPTSKVTASMNRGVHSRGYLPHWDFCKSLQAVTFCLADSVPTKVINQWRLELDSEADKTTRELELHRRIARYEDNGHGEAILRTPQLAQVVQTKLIYIRNNPVKAGLCIHPEDWPFSSAGIGWGAAQTERGLQSAAKTNMNAAD